MSALVLHMGLVVKRVSIVGYLFDEILFRMEKAYNAFEKKCITVLSNKYVFFAYMSALSTWLVLSVLHKLQYQTGWLENVGVFASIFLLYSFVFSGQIDRDTYMSSDLEYDPDYGYGAQD